MPPPLEPARAVPKPKFRSKEVCALATGATASMRGRTTREQRISFTSEISISFCKVLRNRKKPPRFWESHVFQSTQQVDICVDVMVSGYVSDVTTNAVRRHRQDNGTYTETYRSTWVPAGRPN